MVGENAPSQLILYHYPDLKEEKGVVLMTAEMDHKFIVRPLPHWLHGFQDEQNSPVCLKLRVALLLSDRPPGPVFGQSGAAVLRHTATRDVPVGGGV